MTRPRLPSSLPRSICSSSGATAQRRCIHKVPTLTYESKFQKNGVPNFLSPHAFDLAFTQYQGFVVGKLNQLTAGTEFEHKTTREIIVETARSPDSAPTFNYASMAHNNHFFFSGLSAHPESKPSTVLTRQLSSVFGSPDTLRREFIVHADAMFGPGFVWLVKHNFPGAPRKLSLMNTYLAGTPYPDAHARRQGVDMNTEDRPAGNTRDAVRQQLGFDPSESQSPPSNAVGRHGPLSTPRGNRALSSTRRDRSLDLEPVLCLNTWEHVWLPDYQVVREGVSGKRLYVENWWYSVDWDAVQHRLGSAFNEQTRSYVT